MFCQKLSMFLWVSGGGGCLLPPSSLPPSSPVSISPSPVRVLGDLDVRSISARKDLAEHAPPDPSGGESLCPRSPPEDERLRAALSTVTPDNGRKEC